MTPISAVILPKALAAGEKYTITTTYNGKEAVSNEGNGNYFPIARENWYPNNGSSSLGEYTAYDMTFRIPKGMKIAATGSLVSDTNDGGQDVTVWKSEVPQTVAGFNFGRFKVEEEPKSESVQPAIKPSDWVQSYANETTFPASARTLWPRQHEHDGHDEACARGRTVFDPALLRLLRSASYKRLAMTPADGMQLRAILARAGLAADLFVLRQHRAARTWASIGATAATGRLWRRTKSLISGGDTPSGSIPIATSG